MVSIGYHSLGGLECVVCVEIAHVVVLRIIIKLECIILLLLIILPQCPTNRWPITLQSVWLRVLANILYQFLVNPSLVLCAYRAVSQVWLVFVGGVLGFLAHIASIKVARIVFSVFCLGLVLRIESLLGLLRPTLCLMCVSVRATLLKVVHVSLL